jgi:hypothetical protein
MYLHSGFWTLSSSKTNKKKVNPVRTEAIFSKPLVKLSRLDGDDPSAPAHTVAKHEKLSKAPSPQNVCPPVSCGFPNRAAPYDEKNRVLIRILATLWQNLMKPTDIRKPHGVGFANVPSPSGCCSIGSASTCPNNPWGQLSLDDLASKSAPTLAVVRTRQDDSQPPRLKQDTNMW